MTSPRPPLLRRTHAAAIAGALTASLLLTPTADAQHRLRLEPTGVAGIDDILTASGSVDQSPGFRQVSTVLPDGVRLTVTLNDMVVRRTAPLDSSSLSTALYLDGDFLSQITGPEGAQVTGAIFEAGYQLGYPFSLYPDGITMTVKTPEVSVTGGVAIAPAIDFHGTSDATVGGPIISVPVPIPPVVVPVPAVIPNHGDGHFTVSGQANVSATASASVTGTIPTQSIPVDVRHQGTSEVALSQIWQLTPAAYGAYSGVLITATGVMGPVRVRPYVKLAVSTAAGDGVVTAYGNPVTA